MNAPPTTAGKPLLIGIGTGRSGSVSLYYLLKQQEGTAFSHEHRPLLPWQVSERAFERKVGTLLGRDGRLVGDVCHSWLPYIPMLLERYPQARVICLEREREAVVASFMQKLRRKNKNHWVPDPGRQWRRDRRFDPTFPKYASMDLDAAIRRYWEEYHETVAALLERYPGRIRRWNTDAALNAPEGMADLLTFAGIAPAAQRLSVGERHNQGRDRSPRPGPWQRFLNGLRRLAGVKRQH